jgi:hypothetical protein
MRVPQFFVRFLDGRHARLFEPLTTVLRSVI